MKRSNAKGFTLIELLVVVSIIALLMAVLLPSLGAARNKAKTVTCLSNLKQVGNAYIIYCNTENNTRNFVQANASTTTGAGGFWMAVIQTYLGNDTTQGLGSGTGGGSGKNVLFCPFANNWAGGSGNDWAFSNTAWNGDPNSGLWMKAVNPYKTLPGNMPADMQGQPVTSTSIGYKGSYGINGWLNQLVTNVPLNGAMQSLTSVASPGTTPMFMDSIWPDQGTRTGITGPTENYPTASNTLEGGQTANSTPQTARICINRHNMAINMTYADSHAETVKLKQIWHQTWYNGWQNPTTPALDIHLPTK